MNLLHLFGEHPLRAVLVALVLALVVVSVAGITRWRPMRHGTAASSPAAAASSPAAAAPSAPTPAPETAGAPTANPAEAEATALAFCEQYFASSWQESPAQEQARVAPYLTARALNGWRAQLTPAEVAARETAKVNACSATDEGPASGSGLGFFLDAQVVTTSSAGSRTGTGAAEVFLVAVAGAWKVDRVRT